MEPIPIYDATAPIVCTIAEQETPERIAVVERLRRTLQRVDRTPDGLLLEFPDWPGVAADVEQFTIDEKRCCQFWGFAVTTADDVITMRWDGPPDAAAIVDLLFESFTGDEALRLDSGIF